MLTIIVLSYYILGKIDQFLSLYVCYSLPGFPSFASPFWCYLYRDW